MYEVYTYLDVCEKKKYARLMKKCEIVVLTYCSIAVYEIAPE